MLNYNSYHFRPLKKPLPEILPVFLFSKGRELFGIRWSVPSTFSSFEKR
jgi:hypothetical protein